MKTCRAIEPVVQQRPEGDDTSISEFLLIYATHNADHSNLSDDQHLAVQHYREALVRLHRKQVAYEGYVASTTLTPLGLARRLSARQQDTVYELTTGFFDQVYSTLSALASVHSRLRPIRGYGEPPTRTNEKFLKWWTEVIGSSRGEDATETLMNARNFRTLNAHPQQFAVFDWQTVSFGADEVRVVLVGRESSAGNVPEGAHRQATHPEMWRMIAPAMSDVIEAFYVLSSYTFGALSDLFPLEDEDQFCTWEADGHGSGPGLAVLAALLTAMRAMTDPEARARLAPDAEHDLERYISVLEGLRVRADAVSERRSARALASTRP